MISARVTIRTPGLDRTQQALAGMNRVPPPPAVARMYDQWAKRYEVFVRRRFNAYSRGGGDWPALALSTVRARRAAGRGSLGAAGSNDRSSLARKAGRLVDAGRTVTILKDTGALFNALTIAAPGNIKTFIPNGVRFGIGGPAIHPRKAQQQRLRREINKVRRSLGASGRKGGKVSTLTIGRLAAIHDQGEGHNPRRQIIAQPDQQTIAGMARDAQAMLAVLMKGGGA